jgi:hypothetical protein
LARRSVIVNLWRRLMGCLRLGVVLVRKEASGGRVGCLIGLEKALVFCLEASAVCRWWRRCLD